MAAAVGRFSGSGGLKFIANTTNSSLGYCVMRANPNDLGVPLVGASTSGGCVKFNNTADDCSTYTYTNMPSEYSGCNRTACNWTAANSICASYNTNAALNPLRTDYQWRLPTSSELLTWKSGSNITISSSLYGGLNLCDWDSGNFWAQCKHLWDKSCPNGYCDLNRVWGIDYQYGCLNNQSWKTHSYSSGILYGLSVRCILE